MENKKLTITEISDGYIEPIITPEDYVSGEARSISNKLGGVDPIIQEDGQWDEFLPENEIQVKGFDSFGCVIFGGENQGEILSKKVFGGEPNYSDRFLYNAAKVSPPGSDPSVVYEVIRNTGLIDETDLPWGDNIKTIEEYKQPNPLPQNLIDKAKGWLLKYNFRHEYLKRKLDGLIDNEVIKEKLKFSPVAVAVHAWVFDGEKYIRNGGQDTHWTVIYGYDTAGRFLCYDSYPPFKKILDKNFGFKTAKRIWLSRNLTPPQTSIFLKILEAMKQVLSLQWLWIEKIKKKDDTENEPKPEPVEPPEPEPVIKVSKILGFCQSIKIHEGFFEGSRSQRGNNPGNLKYTKLTASLGATRADIDNFAYFPTYEIGWQALISFVKLAANNQLKNYKDCSILSFFKTYAPSFENDSIRYAEFVARQINESPESLLKDFI